MLGDKIMNEAKWQLLKPEGTMEIKERKINPHPKDLNGKTVLLHWNGKHNGDVLLNQIGGLLSNRWKDLKVIKGWDVLPTTRMVSNGPENSKLIANQIAGLKPDMVIGGPGD
jgi:hypothetical protein